MTLVILPPCFSIFSQADATCAGKQYSTVSSKNLQKYEFPCPSDASANPAIPFGR
eukprot:CAMPEP_0113643034 /NCGR_PEP_ID=MMETSP0017_2-20120614/22614_1 /TAXON_ID=2856 /ORGANISM="Cylindrotheca closterium" /LENGTH=54 /DNA_ID=CAMNT_0000554501 /DNA_START=101 /DNA_END=261 /DNA_ORIENTATION=+ /assembly_acc=CAM_ASM_000147